MYQKGSNTLVRMRKEEKNDVDVENEVSVGLKWQMWGLSGKCWAKEEVSVEGLIEELLQEVYGG